LTDFPLMPMRNIAELRTILLRWTASTWQGTSANIMLADLRDPRKLMPAIVCIVVLLLAFALIIKHAATSAPNIEAASPNQSHWVDCGTIFGHGKAGEWDFHLWGGFASSVVKKDGVFYLFYQGAQGYDEGEETVTWRAIGVATSKDGVHFAKYEGNPVLTWFPHNHLEEGAVSAGAFVEDNGEIALYHGANSWTGGGSVSADARLATSADGFHFQDQGIVLDHGASAVWGAGDELFPVVGIQDSGEWFLYYIPNGTPQKHTLGVAWGNTRLQLTSSAPALVNGIPIAAWGPASVVPLSEDLLYAIFVNNVYGPNGPYLEARTVSLDSPNILSAPVVTYQFDHIWEATVLMDKETNTWYMYYRSADHDRYGVMVAAADGREVTCPGFRGYLPVVRQQAEARATSPVRRSGLAERVR
jgi:hypothetical protein